MFVLKCEIIIGKYMFNAVTDIVINKSVENLEDSAILKFPRKFKLRQSGETIFVENGIKVNDKVYIKLWYEGKEEKTEFVGYVTKINPKIPLEIHCEDSMYLLKKVNINKSYKNTTLKAVLQDIVKDTEGLFKEKNEVLKGNDIYMKNTKIEIAENVPDLKIDSLIIQNQNGAQVLQHIKENYFLTSFIDEDNKLYCGFKEGINIGKKVNYDLNYNIIKNNLEFVSEDQTKLRVRYTYIDKKNNKLAVEVGDEDGELRTYHTATISDKTELLKIANEKLKQIKYNGFTGSIESFLLPFATRGMVAHIIDDEHPEYNAKYFISSVEITFGMSGARRKVTISNKL